MWGSKFAAVAKRLWGLIHTRICLPRKYVPTFTHLFVHSVRSDDFLSLQLHTVTLSRALSRAANCRDEWSRGTGAAPPEVEEVEEVAKRLSRRTRKVMGARHYPAEQRARSSPPATAHQFASS